MTTQFTRRDVDAMMAALGSFATETDAQFYLHKTGGQVSEDSLRPVMDAMNLLSDAEIRAEYAKFGLTYGE